MFATHALEQAKKLKGIRVMSVESAGSMTFLLDSRGRVFAWGKDETSSGLFGNPAISSSNKAIRVQGLDSIK